ncbi:twin-arginine translocase TatA/TatE family subunit [Microbacterium sp. ARD32]|uniref:Sec-independent protein translocase TatB n=1 Tax=Microbacterium sp. ARD32 TaxID=2962577 RepID=UPI0028812B1B|nr:Sec-independent protein translocase TatB [Microbacterium sp. ARD32]MDT0156695.1 twin-arginine translocase TatA/TatE family subunit [Microbacterium sp. ARD32]
MELGLTFDKLLLIGLVAVLIIGPERLPKAAETFARFVRRAGEYLRDTKTKMKDELGPEIDEVDWRKLDPRQYDPRRIIRDALFEEPAFDTARAMSNPFTTDPVSADPVATDPVGAAPARAPRAREVFTRLSPPPFDAEAT